MRKPKKTKQVKTTMAVRAGEHIKPGNVCVLVAPPFHELTAYVARGLYPAETSAQAGKMVALTMQGPARFGYSVDHWDIIDDLKRRIRAGKSRLSLVRWITKIEKCYRRK